MLSTSARAAQEAHEAQRSPVVQHDIATDAQPVQIDPASNARGRWIMNRAGAKAPAELFHKDQVDKKTPLAGVDRAAVMDLLRSQATSLYASVSFLGKTYLIAPGDILTVPGMPNVHVGDVLHLDRVHEIGTRDYVLRGQESLWRRMHRPQQVRQLRPTQQDVLLPPEEQNPEIQALQQRIPGSFRDQPAPEGAQSLLQFALERGLRQENSWTANAASVDGIANKGVTLPALVGLTPEQTERIGNDATPSEPYSSSALAGAVGQAALPVVQIEATVVEHTHSPVWTKVRHVQRKWTRYSNHQEQYTRIRIDSIRLP